MRGADDAAPPVEAARAGRFDLVRSLGGGGGGRVHLVRDRWRGGGLRALKTARSFEIADGPEALEATARLMHEARLLSALTHPAIPRLYEVGLSPAHGAWLLMEYVERADDTAPADLAGVAEGLLDGLGYLHRYGWLHGDLKPQNVVAARGGRVALLDFGLAVRQGTPVPPRGTLPYVAPEVLAGEAADPRADLWALGAVLLQMALGRQFQPAAVLAPDDVPDDAALPADWLRRLLRRDRSERFANAERAAADLRRSLGRTSAGPTPRPLPRAPEPAGRGAELGRLERQLEASLTASPQAVDAAAVAGVSGLTLVRGESGVGKSRLLFELRLRAVQAGWSAVSASCAEERDEPLPALGTLLDGILRDAVDSPAVRRRGRAVASLLAARGDQSGAETAARFLLERAREGPGLLLVVEDLQNATAMTLRVLGAIARGVTETHAAGDASRLLVVASLTDGMPLHEEVEQRLAVLEAEGVVATIPLRPLAPADVAAMVAGILGPGAPAERIADVLLAHGGALPLFAEQLLARLVESGALHVESGAGARWALDTKAAPELPETLTAAISSRLQELPQKLLRSLQLIATHELPVPDERVPALLGPDGAAIVGALGERGLVAPAGDGQAVAVVHAVIGRAALAMLSESGRRKMHDAVAARLPRLDPAAALRRAHHLARGSDLDESFRAATGAARRLRAEGEPGRAAEFVRQALRLLSEDDPRIPSVRHSLADLLVASGRPAAAANVYVDLLDAETAPGRRVQLLSGLAEARESAGQSADVVEACSTALDLLGQDGAGLDDVEASFRRLRLLALLAGAQRATGDLRGAIRTIKEALPLAGEGRGGERVALLSLLGNVYVQLGELDRARQFHESCLAACRALGRRRAMATALHNLGVVAARRGQRDEAARYYRQALRLSRRAGDLGGVAQTLGNLANLRAEEGDFEWAEKLQHRSLALRRRIGDLAGIAVTLGNTAGLLRARGRMGAALVLLQKAARRLRALGEVHGEVQFLIQAASVHLFAGDDAGARPLLARATERARASSLRTLEANAEILWGRLERRHDAEGDEWQRRLSHAVSLHEEVGDRCGMAEALIETALGERDRGRRGSAMRAWRSATALVGADAPADLRARVNLVRGRLEWDREPSGEGLEALEAFHAYAHAAGRRDYQVAAAYSLARARLRAGDREGAADALQEATRVEDGLVASLPPALRRKREIGPVPERLRALAEQLSSVASAEEPQSSEASTGEEMDQDRLLKLLEINKQLALAKDIRALLDTIMDVATETTGAERGFLILVEDGRISFQAARNFRREEVAKPELKVSQTLVKRVMRSGQPVLTDNATEDQRFAEFESVERLELKSIVSIPFRLQEKVIGALYLDNPARKGAFGQGDLTFLTALGDQAALAIGNLRHARDMEDLNKQLEKNLEKKSAQLEQAERALAERATKYPYEEIVGASPQIREVLLLLDKVVDTEVPVLIQGESGTGKELVARALHTYGRRKAGPFVTVNCGAIAETLMESELFGHARGAFTGAVADKVGLFMAADGGTIFLDEIGEMSFDMQKKLLRVLQEREVRPVGGKGVAHVDVRVIAATNRNLREMMQQGSFREDLYYRIAVISIDVPPLRERRGDVALLVEHFTERAANELGLRSKPIDAEAMEALEAYAWPGNVRELDNEVKKALTLSDDRIGLDDLSVQIQGDRAGPEPELVRPEEGKTLKENLEMMERSLIEKALDHTGGNQTRAAKDLGISRVWLRKKMEKHGLLGPRR